MTSDERRRDRRLTDDEHALWRDVTRSVAPLRPAAKVARADKTAAAKAADAAKPKGPKAAASPSPRTPPKPQPSPPLAPLGPRRRRKIARGGEAIDARIDLHGMTQAEAHAALTRFLRRAQADDARLVLVITGKGLRGSDGAREGGVLRRQVPLWLRLPELRSVVVGFEEAAVGHGGEGALYVWVRRARSG